MASRATRALRRLSSALLGRARKRSQSIGHITHDTKQTGERRTGNPSAPFDEAGAGNGLTRAPRQSSTLRVGTTGSCVWNFPRTRDTTRVTICHKSSRIAYLPAWVRPRRPKTSRRITAKPSAWRQRAYVLLRDRSQHLESVGEVRDVVERFAGDGLGKRARLTRVAPEGDDTRVVVLHREATVVFRLQHLADVLTRLHERLRNVLRVRSASL